MVIIGVSMPKKNNISYSQDRVINRCIFLEEKKEIREEQNNRQKTTMIMSIVYHCSKKNKDIFIPFNILNTKLLIKSIIIIIMLNISIFLLLFFIVFLLYIHIYYSRNNKISPTIT